jgi:glutamine amidotransferase
MKVVLVEYNAGNYRSVICALNRLGIFPEVSADPATIRRADRVIFPGVGEASTTMQYLHSSGLSSVIVSLTQPILGICLGMQLLCKASEENDTECLNCFSEQVRRFRQMRKIPHIGWNEVYKLTGPLFEGIPEGSHCYFVHSYYVSVGAHTTAETIYGESFSASIQSGNRFAVQFHPEKSGEVGAQILNNFLRLE